MSKYFLSKRILPPCHRPVPQPTVPCPYQARKSESKYSFSKRILPPYHRPVPQPTLPCPYQARKPRPTDQAVRKPDTTRRFEEWCLLLTLITGKTGRALFFHHPASSRLTSKLIAFFICPPLWALSNRGRSPKVPYQSHQYRFRTLTISLMGQAPRLACTPASRCDARRTSSSGGRGTYKRTRHLHSPGPSPPKPPPVQRLIEAHTG